MAIRTLLTLVFIAVAAAGCGRRGALEAPGALSDPAPGSTAGLGFGPVSPGATEPPAVVPAAAPDRPFILDPLI